MNLNDPFQRKILVKKYSNLMIDLYQKGKTQEQIARIIAHREEAPHHNEEPPTFEPGERVTIMEKNGMYAGIIVEECPEYNDGKQRYIVRIAFKDHMKADGSTFFKDMTVIWWHLCAV